MADGAVLGDMAVEQPAQAATQDKPAMDTS